MRVEEVRAIMVEAREKQAETIRAYAYENIEKYIIPYIVKEAKKGKDCTTVSVPEHKEIYVNRLTGLGYNVTCEKGQKLFVRWA